MERKDPKGYYRGHYRCKHCEKQFNVKTGISIFEKSKISLHLWLIAFYFIVEDRCGVSSVTLAKRLEITQKSAWKMGHKIRTAMEERIEEMNEDLILIRGTIELDESFLGGKEKNKHKEKKSGKRGTFGKHTVVGLIERREGGKIRMFYTPYTREEKEKLGGFIKATILKNVKPGSIYTDGATYYSQLYNIGYVVKSTECDNIHTNNIEGSWKSLKDGARAIYKKTFAIKHTQRYLNEFAFRHNEGNQRYTTMERIDSLIDGCWGRKLPYKAMVA